MRNKLFILLFAFCLNFNLFASYFAGISPATAGLISQSESGYSMACFPTSLLYLLKFHPNNNLYHHIPGENDSQKLTHIIEQELSIESPYSGKKIFDEIDGVSFSDGAYFLQQYLPTSDKDYYAFANRQLEETSPGAFLSRIHQKLKHYLILEKPVMALVQFRYTSFEDATSYFSFGHYVVITSIQNQLENGDLGFMIRYLDPATGSVFSAYIYEDINDPFNANLWDLTHSPHSATWSAGKLGVYNYDHQFVSSPYLRLVAPLMSPNKKWRWDVAVDSMLVGLISLGNE